MKRLRKKRVSDFQKKREEYLAIRRGASRVGSKARQYSEQATENFLNPVIENPLMQIPLESLVLTAGVLTLLT